MKSKPFHGLLGRLDPQAGRKHRPLDEDHRQAEIARGIELGASHHAAGILGDEQGNAMLLHQGAVIGTAEGRAGDDHLRPRQRHACRRIDKAQEIGVLGPRGERIEVLPADGEKDAPRFVRQGGDRLCDIRHPLPAIARAGRPSRPFEREQGDAGLLGRQKRVAAHAGGERMRRIHDMRDPLGTKEFHKPRNASEPSNADGQRLRRGFLRAPGIGEERIPARFREQGRQPARLLRSAEKEDARHV